MTLLLRNETSLLSLFETASIPSHNVLPIIFSFSSSSKLKTWTTNKGKVFLNCSYILYRYSIRTIYLLQYYLLPSHNVKGVSTSFDTKDTYLPTTWDSSEHESNLYCGLSSFSLMSESSLPLNQLHKGLSWYSELLPTRISKLEI